MDLVESAVKLKISFIKAYENGSVYKLSMESLNYYQDDLSNRRLSRAISADYFRRKHLSQSAVNEAKAHYIGCHRRLSRAYFSSAMAGLK